MQQKRLLKYPILKNLPTSEANIDINAFAFSSHAEIQNHFAFKLHITLANAALFTQVFPQKVLLGLFLERKPV